MVVHNIHDCKNKAFNYLLQHIDENKAFITLYTIHNQELRKKIIEKYKISKKGLSKNNFDTQTKTEKK